MCNTSEHDDDCELVERIAALCHEQWTGWMEYLFRQCAYGEHNIEIPSQCFFRWQRQMKSTYADLPENEKESDRIEARKFIAALPPYSSAPAGDAREHVDFEFDGFQGCEVCGLVRPADGWKKPCSAVTPEIALRLDRIEWLFREKLGARRVSDTRTSQNGVEING